MVTIKCRLGRGAIAGPIIEYLAVSEYLAMKQILQNLKDGSTEIAEVPCPQVGRGDLLIRTEEDELLPEYDLTCLRVRKFGPAREHFPGHGVVLDPDVAARFPDSAAVNEALRFLLRTAADNQARFAGNVPKPRE